MVPLAILFLMVAVVSLTLWFTSNRKHNPSSPPRSEETPDTETTTARVDPSSLPSIALLETLVRSGDLVAARESAFERLDGIENQADRREVEIFLGDLHTRLVFSRAPMTEKIAHVIRAGDTLGELAETYGTTPEFIAKMNNIQNNIIRVGKSLQILQGTFSAVVDKTDNEMELRLNDRFFKRYLVGTGTDSSTPVGEYAITLRLRHPVWYRPDGRSFAYGHPENLLGTHYLKLNTPGIGLHGTWEPESVGSQSSAGCVRFINERIEELFIILPEGTEVTIQD